MRNTTIILIVENEMEKVKLCIESLRLFNETDNISVVLVDNASTDGLKEWAGRQTDITYVYMDEGRTGYAQIINEVINELKISDDILILYGCYMITPFFLSNLKGTLYQEEKTGAVGPVCNCFKNGQEAACRIKSYENALEAVHPSEGIGKRTLSLDARAVLFKYEAIQKTGIFDGRLQEVQNVGLDYGFRLMRNDYTLCISTDAVLWSLSMDFGRTAGYGSGNGKDMSLLRDKWGMSYFNTTANALLVSAIDRQAEERLDVLEIGCDCGANLLEIKNRFPNAKLTGVEMNEHSAAIAGTAAEIVTADVENEMLPFEDGSFDYILFGDVLEHLHQPEKTVVYCRRLLRPEGHILASIPNLMNISVITELLKGNFTYSDTGLLDCTHVHFFTCNEIIRMFLRAGYQIGEMKSVVVPMTEEQKRVADCLLAMEMGAERHMYETFQYIVDAQQIPNMRKWPELQYRRRYCEDKEYGRGWFSKGRGVVYTVITGEYDRLKDPLQMEKNLDYICFTDNSSLQSETWKIVKMENEANLDRVKLAKKYKIMAGTFLNDYDYSIYVDGKVRITGKVSEFIQKYAKSCSMLCFPHFLRDCIYEEAKVCSRLHKDRPDVVEKQTARYREEGFPEHYGLTDNCILIRDHRDDKLNKVMRDWWEEVVSGSCRDQLSLSYCVWKNRYRYDICDLYSEKNEYFTVEVHIGQEKE